MKIFYMSAHSVLEAEEVGLLNELGHEVFTAGAFVDNLNIGNASLRPSIPNFRNSPELRKEYDKIGAMFPGEDGKDHLTKEFIDFFNAVLVMHIPRWIIKNWDVIKHKRVIWRTIGQSIKEREDELRPFRNKGLQVVRYSPREKFIPGYIGENAMIRFYKDENYWKGWTGEKKQVVTFAQSMKQRNQACNFSFFEEVTRPFQRHLYGPGNEIVGQPWAHGQVTVDEMLKTLQQSRVYFYCGTHPASYTLNFMEALSVGIPLVCIGPEHGNASYFPNHKLYEIPDIIENGVNGFYSDNIGELRGYINYLLTHEEAARRIGQRGRETAIRHFSKEKIKQQWKEFLG
jgi:glycosyltransferase involved in cell wall biosynthesis